MDVAKQEIWTTVTEATATLIFELEKIEDRFSYADRLEVLMLINDKITSIAGREPSVALELRTKILATMRAFVAEGLTRYDVDMEKLERELAM